MYPFAKAIHAKVRSTAAFLRKAELLIAMREKQIDPPVFFQIIRQRVAIGGYFQSLLADAMQKAGLVKAWATERALKKNLYDEKGINSEGKVDISLSHDTWRKDFLVSLECLGYDPNAKMVPDVTEAYKRKIHEMMNESLFILIGAILAAEYCIPIECRAIQIIRNSLFHDFFLKQITDSDDLIQEKERRCRYIDDHIIHDSKEHYPDLLNSINEFEGKDSQNTVEKICKGIDFWVDARLFFWQSLYQNVKQSVN